jgi:hypothetical protein
MDIIKVVEIDNKIDLYKFDFPISVEFLDIDFANLPDDFRDKKLLVCTNYINGIKDWIKEQEPQYLNKIKKGIENIQSLAKSRREKLYLDFRSYIGEDYFINLPEWMSFSDNYNSLIDRNNGFPICDDLISSNLKDYINPVYRPALKTIEYLLSLIEDQLGYIIQGIQTEIEYVQSDIRDQNLPIHNQETDLDTIILDDGKGHKMLLLHELGIIDYLIKKYKQNDTTDIATLLTFITGINHSTVRSGIRQYKTNGKGDIYNKTSVKAINKILLDAKMTPIDFKKV